MDIKQVYREKTGLEVYTVALMEQRVEHFSDEYVKWLEKQLSIADVMAMLPPVTFLEKVNRVEVIDQKGRSYVNWKPTNKTELSLQDDGKTLKVFISN